MSQVRADKPFVLAGRTYSSRLLVGTGKYKDLEETRLAIEASGAEIVTVAVRRTNIGQNPGEPNLLDVISSAYLPQEVMDFLQSEIERSKGYKNVAEITFGKGVQGCYLAALLDYFGKSSLPDAPSDLLRNLDGKK